MSHATAAHPNYETLAIPKGRLAMWWFLASEVVTFGGVLSTYMLLRLRHPDWLQQSSKTLLPIGAINTVVLLTSSLTMVLAHSAAKAHDATRVRKWLIPTLLLGVTFLGLKAVEYYHEIEHGRVPTTAVFWGYYYTLTGLHALHVLAGLLLMVHLLLVVGSGRHFMRVEAAALYWHFVDLVWIFLFPLLYVTTQVSGAQ